jgi:transposase InsO family protein
LIDKGFQASPFGVLKVKIRRNFIDWITIEESLGIINSSPEVHLILNERHLRRVLQEHVTYFNERRPHQGLAQDSPLGLAPVSNQGPIRCRKVLGGIISDYYREAA